MSDWDKDLGVLAKTYMELLGNFSPTVKPQDKQVKGYMLDPDGYEGDKVYLDSGELRELALSCNAVADWLDKRAENEGSN